VKATHNLKVLSPAKINLFLHITGKRDNGYHELYSLMTCISLYDKILFSFNTPGINISCSSVDIPDDKTNLAYMAADCFYKKITSGKIKVKPCVSIHIDKVIPVGAGLGGGSSNAASVLKTLNNYYDKPFTDKELMIMGLKLGADVPFFISAKPSIATGIGEKLSRYKDIFPYQVIVVYPGFKVSTIKIFKKFKFNLTKEKKTFKGTCFQGNGFSVGKYLINDLEKVTVSMHHEISSIKQTLMDNGAEGALMSGSGSSVFGLYTKRETALPAYMKLSDIGLEYGWQVNLVNIIN